jgi:hypothetical protein
MDFYRLVHLNMADTTLLLFLWNRMDSDVLGLGQSFKLAKASQKKLSCGEPWQQLGRAYSSGSQLKKP